MLSVASDAYRGLKGSKVKNVDKKPPSHRIKGIHPDDKVNVTAGIPNLPSDNIGDVMTNQFLKDCMRMKIKKDEEIQHVKEKERFKKKSTKMTRADILRGNVRKAQAKELDD